MENDQETGIISVFYPELQVLRVQNSFDTRQTNGWSVYLLQVPGAPK